MTHKAIKINWHGPFEHSDIEQMDAGNGLYLITGKRKGQRSESEIQYFGITEKSYRERFKKHEKLELVTREQKIWIGEIAYPQKYTREHLELAESLMVYFWQPELNDRKKAYAPTPTTIESNWYTADGNPRKNQMSIYKDLPDVISWDGEYWRVGNLKVIEE